MDKKNDGGPAFPSTSESRSYHSVGPEGYHRPAIDRTSGMTLRDWFAGQIAAAIVSHYGFGGDCDSDAAKDATWAYRRADAMLAERAKGRE